MLVSNEQAWVTSAVSNDQVEQALILCCSLRKAYTSRKVAVIASSKISVDLRKALYQAFDFVFYLDEDLNTARLKPDDFAKLYSLLVLGSFKNCAYLSPCMLALKSCDDIFNEPTPGFSFLKNEATDDQDDQDNVDVFLFKPSIDHFKALESCCEKLNVNGHGIGTYLNKWAKNQFKDVGSLDGKYNKVLSREKGLVGYEHEISFVNLINYPTQADVDNLDKTNGLLGKLVGIHWNKIRNDNVLPLIHGSNLSLPRQPVYSKEPIAIVGMSCRYPGANSLEEFWDLLFQGQDGTGTPPEFRWLREQSSRRVADARKTNAGFLKVPVDEFDGKFFGISPKEVLFMDPQHRLLHEVIWEGLEDACIDPHELRGSSGAVFLGSWLHDYRDILVEGGLAEFYRVYMGNSIGAATARLSFTLGLTGPSVATESGCSSAMVAVHLACRSLQNGETSLALAGGVNLLLHQFEKDIMPMVISADGHCKTFSEDANGFARAEGCGVLVLKRLSDALKDGDNVWGLIRGSAITQEGVSQSMGTPTVHCESLAMKEALADGGVGPEEVSYVEAHGTGTVVGDPMEVAAIANAYHSTARKEPLIIGSVKTNVGHTESCSGITGIMKVVLAMQNEAIPAHLHFTKLNPEIDLDVIPAVIPTELVPWKKVEGSKRLAGVSSFGITGTDAHVIIEETPQGREKGQVETVKNALKVADLERSLHLLKISAKTDEALEELLSKYKEIMQNSEESLSDIAYSSNLGRANFANRAVIIARNKEEVVTSIEKQKYLHGEANGDLGKVCFLFTGQGSQYPGMGKTLYDTSPVFKMHFDYCEKVLKDTYKISLKDVLWSGNEEQISRTIYSQTGIFCVEYALLKLWESWGIKPDYCLGHSLGEFCAAVCAGLISVEDAIKLVAERSRLIDSLPQGKMLVIQADYPEVQRKLSRFSGVGVLDFAAINSNQQTVVAGDSEVVLNFAKFLKEEHNIKCLVLAATHAFHSKHMDPMLDKYRRVAKSIKYARDLSKCEYISGMKGDLVSSGNIDPEYWVQHTREKVNFLSASKKAVELGCQIFIEIGPQPVLSALTMMNTEDTPTGTSLVFLPSLKKKEDEWTTILGTLGKLYLKGLSVDWVGFEQFYARQKIRGLPHYPFMGKKYWPDLMQVTGNSIHPLVGSVIPNASSTKIFQGGLNLRTQEYVKDHAIGQTVVFPGAGYLEMCLAAGLATVEGSVESLAKPSRPMKVENLMIKAPLALEEGKTCQVQTVAELNTSPDNPNDWNDVSIKIFHRLENNWLCHATATFVPVPSAEELKDLTGEFTEESFTITLESPSNDDQVIEKGYDKLASIGLKFGPTFKSLEKLWREEGENPKSLLAKVKVPSQQNDGEGHIIHPAVLDAMIQAIMMLNVTNKLKNKLYVPIRIGKFLWLSNSLMEDEERYIHVFESSADANKPDVTSGPSIITALLVDSSGKVLALMADVELIDTTVKAVEAVLEQQTSQMTDLWEESWRPKIGPCQYRHDLTLCRREEIYDDKFYQYIYQKYNEVTPELALMFQNLEHMVYLNMLRALYKCGWEVPPLGEIFQEDALITKLCIQKERIKMFQYLLRILQEEGILQKQQSPKPSDGNHWKLVVVPPTLSQIEEQLRSPTYTEELVKMFNPTLLLAKIGENYSEILQGKQSALPILFPEENTGKREWPPVSEFYTVYGHHTKIFESVHEVASIQLDDCMHHMGETRDVMRALEFGAGTGSFTEGFLKVVDERELELEFYYTDISAAFFPAAEKKFEKHLKQITFKKFNVEEDPISQGFPPNYFDYIMASEVLHAVRDIHQALRNIRMLLRPGGKLFIQDMTRVSRPITYLFGPLDGFWRFEDFDLRQDHCTLSTEKWIMSFNKAGFEVLPAFPTLNHQHSLFVAYKIQEDEICPMISFPDQPITKNSKIWVVFHHEDSPTSNFLLEKIPSVENRHVVKVTRGQIFQSFNDGLANWSFQANPASEQDFISVLEAVGGKATIEGVLYCWSLDKTCKTQDTLLQPYFYTIKTVLQLKQNQLPRLMTLVNGLYSLPIENNLGHCYASTVSGMTKSVRNERIDWSHCCCIDIGGEDCNLQGVTGEQVFLELWSMEKEPQVCFHEKTRYISRIQTLKPTLSDLKLPGNCSSDRFQLILPETKLIDDLEFGPLDPLILEKGEIEIQVKTSALNFRDVFSVIKPTEKFKDCNAVGFDFAGVVKRVGPDVTKWSVGDRVFGVNVNGAALPSHIKVDEVDVLPVPDEMPFADACTLPAVVATSYYCLVDVAKITASDTVLIHTASGGVGLSAIEICRSAGCTIIATAGSNRKRNYLRSLGIRHVFHSRNTQYGEEILKVTNSQGVNVVLNSLTGEGFKEATLNCCAKNARFVEMSKLNVWTLEEVQNLRPDVKYTIADLSSMEQPEWRRLMSTLRELADKKVVNPIPYVRFDGVHVREALQYMQKAKHIGKVVCVMPEVRLENGRGQVYTPIFNEQASYLITGGLGGIGFTVCKWMVQRGAKHVLLAGRNPPKPEMQISINKLNGESGANVQAVQLDVGDFNQCRDLIHRKIPEELRLPPLRGIMHAAGTLNDGLIENQTWPKLSSTFNAKVDGTSNLHELSKTLNLEHFVLFSSMASMFGSPGQSNHAAGNHFEDTIAFYRHSIGLPATTVNWGQWGEVGIATEVELPGLKPFSNLQGLTGLEFALKSHRVQTGVLCIDSFVLFAKLFPRISSVMDERMWKSKIGGAGRAMNLQSAEFWQLYDSLETIEEKLTIAKEKISYILKTILKLDESDVLEENTPFQEMGVDSLMFVELKNTLQSLLGSRVIVNANALRDCNTVSLLADKLVKMIEGEEVDLDDKIPSFEEVTQLIKEDCQLPEHIHSKPDQLVTDVSKIAIVLVTGCTGTLGPYILKELTAKPQITQVICLVRPTKTLTGEERLKNILKERELLDKVDMDKIRCVHGNVGLENLGIEPMEWEELCNSVDAVFHCAASVQHVEHYRKREGVSSQKDMRAVNINGTKNVLEFACTGSKLKQIYCASSLLAVATVGSNGTLNDDWPEPTDYDGVATIAYPVTKFVCDVLLKQAVLERGIPAKVFRLPLIVGDSKTGRCILDQNHYMLRYMFILKHGVMPSNPVPVAMLPVDICAWASVNIFFNEKAPNDIYNICNKCPDTDQQFVEVASRLGFKVDIVEFSEFSKKIRESTEADSPLAIFKEIYKNDDDLMAIYNSAPALRHWLLEAGGDLSVFVSKKLEKVLPEMFTNESYLECTMEYIYRDLCFAKKQGWFERFKL